MPQEMTSNDIQQNGQGPGAGEVVVSFENVSIRFDEKLVLQNVSFTVHRGETYIILGPAGGGKSVLMKLTNGLLRPDSGTIRVFGEDITAMSERDLFTMRKRVGMVFQESALFDSLSVEENVAYRLNEERVPEKEAHERVVEHQIAADDRPRLCERARRHGKQQHGRCPHRGDEPRKRCAVRAEYAHGDTRERDANQRADA